MVKKIFISAGEQSGDLHASKLMREIKTLVPEVQFFGIGGELMQKEGLNSIADIKQISVIGFWEVAKKILYFSEIFNQCKKILISENIDIFIPVDYPGFNLRLAQFSKNNNIKVIYYIAPQLWAWGKNRAEKLKNSLDRLLVVFPFEVDYFKSFGIDVSFVGHPLLDNPEFKSEIVKAENRQKMIAFLPGSRIQELKRHIPLINQISYKIIEKVPDIKFGISLPSHLKINSLIKSDDMIQWHYFSNSIELMQKSLVGLIKAGTSNLEAALCGLPFALIYKTSYISYTLGKNLVNLPYLSIVNILHNQNIIQEFIQSGASPDKIATYLLNLLQSKEEYNKIQNKLIELRKFLGQSGASRKAAEIIANYL